MACVSAPPLLLLSSAVLFPFSPCLLPPLSPKVMHRAMPSLSSFERQHLLQDTCGLQHCRTPLDNTTTSRSGGSFGGGGGGGGGGGTPEDPNKNQSFFFQSRPESPHLGKEAWGVAAHGAANGAANGAAGGADGEEGEEGATDGEIAAASTNTINACGNPQRITAYNAATTVTTLARVDAPRVDAPVNPLHLHFHDSILHRHQIHAMCDFTRLWQGEKREGGGGA